MLSMKLLGEISFSIDGTAIKSLRSRTASALLVYLACHKRPFTREFLAEFFWEDRDTSQASANLRTALKLLRRPFGDYLIITRQSVSFNHETEHEIDALIFAQQINTLLSWEQVPLKADTAVQLATNLAQYQGDFLHGFYLPHAPSFEQWQAVEQARYRRLAERGLRQLVNFYLRNGRYSDGIDHATRLLTINPFDETAQRQMMELLWRNGNRNAALRQFDSLRQLLTEELDVAPAADTIALYNRIRTAPSRPKPNLPAQTTPFVGRQQDLYALQKNLATPDCRLVTILGPGGVGKTRLLLTLGQKTVAARPGQFVNGVTFVPLAHLNTAQFLDTAIAEAVGVTLSGSDDPLIDLLNHLREKEMLLLLDNFEHLLEGEDNLTHSLKTITQILEAAPYVKLVITSRVRLQLQEEWVFDLRGLSLPPANWETDNQPIEEETAVSFAAIHLFLQCTRRIHRNFTTTDSNLRIIARVCRLLDGLPLAIEMAASWMRQLSAAEILLQIEMDIDFLQMSVRNMPARHRTLRVVFDTSWKLLNERETAVLRQLAIFRGPFTIEAAQAIVGADASLLSALVDKSFLQVNNQAVHIVYDMHQMLRQYALEHLEQQPQEHRQASAAHAAFHADFVQQRTNAIKNGGPKQVFDEIAELIDEVRAVWNWSLNNSELAYVERSLEGLFYFYWVKGWLNEGADWSARVAQIVPTEMTGNKLLPLRGQMWQAEFEAWLGHYEEAGDLFTQVMNNARHPEAMPELVFAMNGLGRVQFWQGMYPEAESTFTSCLAWARNLEDGHAISLALNCLANTIAEARMDYDETWALLEESLAISQEMEDQYGSARALINMGSVAQERDDLATSKQLFTQSLEIYRQIGYQHGIAAALNYLGQVAYQRDEYEQAQALIRESYELHWESGDRRGMVDALKQLGNVAREAGNLQEAGQRYQEALQIAQDLDAAQMVLAILLETAVLLQQENQQKALTLLLFIADHPATGKELSAAAEAVTAELHAQQSVENQTPYHQKAKTLTLTEAIQLASDNSILH